jgi:hypothetical protein
MKLLSAALFSCLFILKFNGCSSGLSAAIVSFIHDERDILDYWIRYHSKIVGTNNIAIIDHDSPPESKQILEKWEKEGLHVVRGNFSYFEKGPITTRVYKEYFPQVEIAIPLDSDEFLFSISDPTKVPEHYHFGFFSPENIRQQLMIFARSKFTCYTMLDIFNNCNTNLNDTVETITTFSTIPPEFAYWRKRIYKLASLQELDHGSHHGKFKGKCTFPHTLGLLHFHNRNLLLKVQRALNDLIGFGYANKTDSLESIKGKLSHFQELARVPKLWGRHKVHEIIDYLQNGTESLVSPCPQNQTQVFTTPTLMELIAKNNLKSSRIELNKTAEMKYRDKVH